MPLLHIGPNLIQDEGDDMGLHSQEQNITVPHSVLIASSQIHAHLLQKRTQSIVPGNMAEPIPPREQLNPPLTVATKTLYSVPSGLHDYPQMIISQSSH